MILIISSQHDQNVNEVIDWLDLYKKKYVRIYEETVIKLSYLSLDNNNVDFELECEDNFISFKIKYSNISSVWYRWGKFKINVPSIDIALKEVLIEYFNGEVKVVNYFIHKLLKLKRHINSYLDNNVSKLDMLLCAIKHNLIIPNTLISSDLSKLKFFYKHNKGGVISKAIEYSYINPEEGIDIGGYTSLVLDKNFKIANNFVFPSLLQKCIEKKFEVRTFYLNGDFYSTAIFSQNDTQTKIDFRNYNFDKMNRVVPYKLPYNIEEKLSNFCKELQINCGSFDIVVDINMEYIFLEINPIGQFQQVSKPCNYNLHYKIAQYLINE